MLLYHVVVLVTFFVGKVSLDPVIKTNVTAEGKATCNGNPLLAAHWNVSLIVVRSSRSIVDCDRAHGDVVSNVHVRPGGGYQISGSAYETFVDGRVAFCLYLVHDCKYPMGPYHGPLHSRILIPAEYASLGEHRGKVFEHDFELPWH